MSPTPDRVAILDELAWRGLIAISTEAEALRRTFEAGPVSYYCGFDPTAPSLHFGNLVQLVTMRRLQLAGHRPVGLVGGATGLVGDPSGRSAERGFHDEQVIGEWVDRIRPQVERYLAFDGDNAAILVNNLDWTGPMRAITFLRDIGRHFSVARMLEKESVSARMESGGITFTEFSYQIMQALDYLELYRRHGCVLQTGGSDQWGNLTAGVDLIRRVEGATVHAVATPLLTRADGTKYGKSEGETVWLSAELTSPYAFYQYFLNTDDADVVALLKVFSFRQRPEIEELARAVAERPEERAAQRALAEELTTTVHGAEETSRVAAVSAALFGAGDLRALDADTFAAAAAELPRTAVPRDGDLPPLAELFVASGLLRSLGDVRRTAASGGLYLNNERVVDPGTPPSADVLIHGRWLVLRRGKRSLAVAEVS